MSTLAQIQEAVARLPGHERDALRLWLDSQAEPQLTEREEQCLLRSLDEAVREVDAGRGISLAEMRKKLGSWAAT